jgi:GNAT superfamily N-acetyltransferase
VLWTDTRFRRAHRFYERWSYVRDGPIRALHDIADTVEYRYAKPVQGVRRLDVAAARSAERRLAEVLRAGVMAGASASFLPPLSAERALAFWQGVTRRVGEAETALFAAWSEGVLAGTVQLLLDMPENGRHRAVVTELLVHPAFRRRGLGDALMQAAEAEASALGRTLLEFDTCAGSPAEALSRRRGWIEAGRIEGYTIDADGREHATLRFTKRVRAPDVRSSLA